MRNKKLAVILSIFAVFALLLILGSVIFSIGRIESYCYNADDAQLKAEVIAAAESARGQSVFLLDDEKLIAEIYKKVPNIEIVNIERTPPNGICVNFVKLLEYFYVSSGAEYLVCSQDGRVVRVTETEPLSLIRVDLSPTASASASLGFLVTSPASQAEVAIATARAIARLDYAPVVTEVFESVSLSIPERVVLTLRSGARIEIVQTNSIFDKLWRAYTVYVGLPDTQKTAGTVLTVANNLRVSVDTDS